MITKNYIMASILGLTLLTSCAPTTMDENNSDSRSVREISNDMSIKNHIKAHLIQDHMFSSVGVKVSEGRVLLTGKVSNPLDKLEASKIAWSQVGVKEVNNSVIITNKTAKSIDQVTGDSMITSKIKSKMLVADNIRSMNYGFETIDGVVYILGIARNQSELNDVISIVSNVDGVKKVESYVKVKSYI